MGIQLALSLKSFKFLISLIFQAFIHFFIFHINFFEYYWMFAVMRKHWFFLNWQKRKCLVVLFMSNRFRKLVVSLSHIWIETLTEVFSLNDLSKYGFRPSSFHTLVKSFLEKRNELFWLTHCKLNVIIPKRK